MTAVLAVSPRNHDALSLSPAYCLTRYHSITAEAKRNTGQEWGSSLRAFPSHLLRQSYQPWRALLSGGPNRFVALPCTRVSRLTIKDNPRGAAFPRRMAAEPKTEESDFPTPQYLSSPSEKASPKASVKTKSPSQPRAADKDAASAKRRCVSTACIACRKRKSKVCLSYVSHSVERTTRLTLDVISATAILRAVLHVPPSTAPNVSTTPTQTIGGKAYIRRTSTTSRHVTLPYRPSFRLYSTSQNMKYQIWSSRYGRVRAWTMWQNPL